MYIMLDIELILPYLLATQWLVACFFVPMLCWYEGLNSSRFCIGCTLLSGYLVQIGFYQLMEGAGFRHSMLILFAAMAAFIWVHYFVRAWPSKKPKQSEPLTPATEDMRSSNQ